MSEAAPSPEQQAGRGRPRSTAGRNLLKAHEEAVALIEGVPFTNNQAEPVKQKVSGCFRTDQGAAVYARLQAVISTCRKQTSLPASQSAYSQAARQLLKMIICQDSPT